MIMDLFTPIVPEGKQHPNFRALIQPNFYSSELEVIRDWANNFVDRDGKFVKEFQTTFNSSFWELYLFACFKELGCTVDFSNETPDFSIDSPYGNFIAEATIANHPDRFCPEWDRDILEKADKAEVLRLSTIRLWNSISSKYRKYTDKYSKLSHVQNKPFVICVTPFDQPSFFTQDSLAIVRVLYAYESALSIPGNQDGEIIFTGESRCYQVQKSPGVHLSLGLFTDERMSEVSAVFFNNRATFSKVRALAKEGDYVMFSGARMIQSEKATGLEKFFEARSQYQETILDGLHILVNPFAKNPLDLSIFNNREVAIHSYDPTTESYLSEIPHGFLLQRTSISIGSEENTLELEKSITEHPYQKLSPEVWEEDRLIYIGGKNGPFKDNYMAHYKEWTILVSFDSIDENWGSQSVNSLCYNLPQFIKANMNEDIASSGINEWVSTKEDAYAAMKQKIDFPVR
jgi:hypothetical protein